MTWFNPFHVHCTACPGKCDWNNHEQIREKEIYVTIKLSITIDTLKQRYMQDYNGALDWIKKACEDKIVEAYDKSQKDFRKIQEYIDYINRHSLSKASITRKQFIDDVIAAEEEDKEDGYEQRIRYLKRLVEIRDEDPSSNKLHRAIALIQGMQQL